METPKLVPWQTEAELFGISSGSALFAKIKATSGDLSISLSVTPGYALNNPRLIEG